MVGRRRSRTRRFRLAVVSLATLLVALVAGPVSLASEPEVVYPEVAGTTVIHGDGIVGVTLMLPEPVRILQENLRIEADDGARYVWTGFRSHWEPDVFCDFCLVNMIRLLPENDPAPRMSGCYSEEGEEVGCQYQAKELELYFVTDAPATLTLTLPELSGSIELDATAEVQGALEELRVTGCEPLPDCSQGYSYGGISRTIGLGGPANADVVGYLKAGQGPIGTTNPGVRGLTVCAYPGNFNPGASGDPAEHPTGCDDDQLPVLGVGGEGTTENDGTSEIHGESYLGFKVWNRRLLADAVFGVWGRWLEAGMTCPSLDFHDCMKPPPPGV